MSSLSRKRGRPAAGAVLLAGCAWSGAGWSQQMYFTPKVEVGAEYHTNREMTTIKDLEDESQAYIARLEATLGRRTPLGGTELRPRVVLQEFPDRDGVDPVEVFLDWRTQRTTLKHDFDWLARYSRQDTYNAEFGRASFDDIDPDNPQQPGTESGIVLSGDTRTRITLGPTYEYKLSERSFLGAEADVERQRYSRNNNDFDDRLGYDSYSAGVSYGRVLSQRASWSIGPYFAHYDADEEDITNESVGGTIDFSYRWSQVTEANVALSFEKNDSEERLTTGEVLEDSSSNFGLEFSGRRRGRVGSLRYSIGRFLKPSSIGSRTEVDQFQVQYDRPLSPRLSLNTAVRLAQESRVSLSSDDDRERKLARAEISLTRALTQTLYVTGGVRYAWQKFEGSTDRKADDTAAILTFGYKGRGPSK